MRKRAWHIIWRFSPSLFGQQPRLSLSHDILVERTPSGHRQDSIRWIHHRLLPLLVQIIT
ncbi:hypothetical protein BDP67DRAFT_528845, partial [Colletotrichum lupini]